MLDYQVCFLTEMGFWGKVPPGHPNLRTEFSWMVALDAEHFPLYSVHANPAELEGFDVAIIIPPKKIKEYRTRFNFSYSYFISRVKEYVPVVIVQQEGPNWYWQDYDMDDQVSFFNLLHDSDAIFAHNDEDVLYYKGLVGKEAVYVNPSLMLVDVIDVTKLTNLENRRGTLIGGNMCSWYGGFDSIAVAGLLGGELSIVSMGRKKINEERYFPNVTYLPYMDWNAWIVKLSQYKYGVHMMRTFAAGTFAMNCAYLGITCLGYKNTNTQRLHEYTSVESLQEARELAERLGTDSDFYIMASGAAKKKYLDSVHHLPNYLVHMRKIFKKLL